MPNFGEQNEQQNYPHYFLTTNRVPWKGGKCDIMKETTNDHQEVAQHITKQENIPATAFNCLQEVYDDKSKTPKESKLPIQMGPNIYSENNHNGSNNMNTVLHEYIDNIATVRHVQSKFNTQQAKHVTLQTKESFETAPEKICSVSSNENSRESTYNSNNDVNNSYNSSGFSYIKNPLKQANWRGIEHENATEKPGNENLCSGMTNKNNINSGIQKTLFDYIKNHIENDTVAKVQQSNFPIHSRNHVGYPPHSHTIALNNNARPVATAHENAFILNNNTSGFNNSSKNNHNNYVNYERNKGSTDNPNYASYDHKNSNKSNNYSFGNSINHSSSNTPSNSNHNSYHVRYSNMNRNSDSHKYYIHNNEMAVSNTNIRRRNSSSNNKVSYDGNPSCNNADYGRDKNLNTYLVGNGQLTGNSPNALNALYEYMRKNAVEENSNTKNILDAYINAHIKAKNALCRNSVDINENRKENAKVMENRYINLYKNYAIGMERSSEIYDNTLRSLLKELMSHEETRSCKNKEQENEGGNEQKKEGKEPFIFQNKKILTNSEKNTTDKQENVNGDQTSSLLKNVSKMENMCGVATKSRDKYNHIRDVLIQKYQEERDDSKNTNGICNIPDHNRSMEMLKDRMEMNVPNFKQKLSSSLMSNQIRDKNNISQTHINNRSSIDIGNKNKNKCIYIPSNIFTSSIRNQQSDTPHNIPTNIAFQTTPRNIENKYQINVGALDEQKHNYGEAAASSLINGPQMNSSRNQIANDTANSIPVTNAANNNIRDNGHTEKRPIDQLAAFASEAFFKSVVKQNDAIAYKNILLSPWNKEYIQNILIPPQNCMAGTMQKKGNDTTYVSKSNQANEQKPFVTENSLGTTKHAMDKETMRQKEDALACYKTNYFFLDFLRINMNKENEKKKKRENREIPQNGQDKQEITNNENSRISMEENNNTALSHIDICNKMVEFLKQKNQCMHNNGMQNTKNTNMERIQNYDFASGMYTNITREKKNDEQRLLLNTQGTITTADKESLRMNAMNNLHIKNGNIQENEHRKTYQNKNRGNTDTHVGKHEDTSEEFANSYINDFKNGIESNTMKALMEDYLKYKESFKAGNNTSSTSKENMMIQWNHLFQQSPQFTIKGNKTCYPNYNAYHLPNNYEKMNQTHPRAETPKNIYTPSESNTGFHPLSFTAPLNTLEKNKENFQWNGSGARKMRNNCNNSTNGIINNNINNNSYNKNNSIINYTTNNRSNMNNIVCDSANNRNTIFINSGNNAIFANNVKTVFMHNGTKNKMEVNNNITNIDKGAKENSSTVINNTATTASITINNINNIETSNKRNTTISTTTTTATTTVQRNLFKCAEHVKLPKGRDNKEGNVPFLKEKGVKNVKKNRSDNKEKSKQFSKHLNKKTVFSNAIVDHDKKQKNMADHFVYVISDSEEENNDTFNTAVKNMQQKGSSNKTQDEKEMDNKKAATSGYPLTEKKLTKEKINKEMQNNENDVFLLTNANKELENTTYVNNFRNEPVTLTAENILDNKHALNKHKSSFTSTHINDVEKNEMSVDIGRRNLNSITISSKTDVEKNVKNKRMHISNEKLLIQRTKHKMTEHERAIKRVNYLKQSFTKHNVENEIESKTETSDFTNGLQTNHMNSFGTITKKKTQKESVEKDEEKKKDEKQKMYEKEKVEEIYPEEKFDRECKDKRNPKMTKKYEIHDEEKHSEGRNKEQQSEKGFIDEIGDVSSSSSGEIFDNTTSRSSSDMLESLSFYEEVDKIFVNRQSEERFKCFSDITEKYKIEYKNNTELLNVHLREVCSYINIEPQDNQKAKKAKVKDNVSCDEIEDSSGYAKEIIENNNECEIITITDSTDEEERETSKLFDITGNADGNEVTENVECGNYDSSSVSSKQESIVNEKKRNQQETSRDGKFCGYGTYVRRQRFIGKDSRMRICEEALKKRKQIIRCIMKKMLKGSDEELMKKNDDEDEDEEEEKNEFEKEARYGRKNSEHKQKPKHQQIYESKIEEQQKQESEEGEEHKNRTTEEELYDEISYKSDWGNIYACTEEEEKHGEENEEEGEMHNGIAIKGDSDTDIKEEWMLKELGQNEEKLKNGYILCDQTKGLFNQNRMTVNYITLCSTVVNENYNILKKFLKVQCSETKFVLEIPRKKKDKLVQKRKQSWSRDVDVHKNDVLKTQNQWNNKCIIEKENYRDENSTEELEWGSNTEKDEEIKHTKIKEEQEDNDEEIEEEYVEDVEEEYVDDVEEEYVDDVEEEYVDDIQEDCVDDVEEGEYGEDVEGGEYGEDAEEEYEGDAEEEYEGDVEEEYEGDVEEEYEGDVEEEYEGDVEEEYEGDVEEEYGDEVEVEEECGENVQKEYGEDVEKEYGEDVEEEYREDVEDEYWKGAEADVEEEYEEDVEEEYEGGDVEKECGDAVEEECGDAVEEECGDAVEEGYEDDVEEEHGGIEEGYGDDVEEEYGDEYGDDAEEEYGDDAEEDIEEDYGDSPDEDIDEWRNDEENKDDTANGDLAHMENKSVSSERSEITFDENEHWDCDVEMEWESDEETDTESEEDIITGEENHSVNGTEDQVLKKYDQETEIKNEDKVEMEMECYSFHGIWGDAETEELEMGGEELLEMDEERESGDYDVEDQPEAHNKKKVMKIKEHEEKEDEEEDEERRGNLSKVTAITNTTIRGVFEDTDKEEGFQADTEDMCETIRTLSDYSTSVDHCDIYNKDNLIEQYEQLKKKAVSMLTEVIEKYIYDHYVENLKRFRKGSISRTLKNSEIEKIKNKIKMNELLTEKDIKFLTSLFHHKYIKTELGNIGIYNVVPAYNFDVLTPFEYQMAKRVKQWHCECLSVAITPIEKMILKYANAALPNINITDDKFALYIIRHPYRQTVCPIKTILDEAKGIKNERKRKRSDSGKCIWEFDARWDQREQAKWVSVASSQQPMRKNTSGSKEKGNGKEEQKEDTYLKYMIGKNKKEEHFLRSIYCKLQRRFNF